MDIGASDHVLSRHASGAVQGCFRGFLVLQHSIQNNLASGCQHVDFYRDLPDVLEPHLYADHRGVQHLLFSIDPDIDADSRPGASTSQPYTLHLYDANTSGLFSVNQSPMRTEARQQSKSEGVTQQSTERQGWSLRRPKQAAHIAQQPRGMAAAQLQSRQLAPGTVQRGNVGASMQLRTPARPNSAGSALRGYVPPEHR